ncbi:hypothetical protein ACTFIR_005465 [Dictyostelium discoideum]
MSNKQIFLKFKSGEIILNNFNKYTDSISSKLLFYQNIKNQENNSGNENYKNFNYKNKNNNNYNYNNNSNNNNNNNNNGSNSNNNIKFNSLFISSIYLYNNNNNNNDLKNDKNDNSIGIINKIIKPKIENQDLLNPFEAIKEIVGNKEDEEINLVKIGIRVLELGLILLPSVLTFPCCFIPGVKELWWQLLLETIQFSGTCWIKFGQWISTRPDLFPDLLIEKFSQLHSQCPSHSFQFTNESIENSFNGKSIPDLFLWFDEEPMASGSVAQVHKALTMDGKVAVVKVLHPNVKSNIKRDFFIIYSLIWAFSHIPEMKWLSLPESILEFGKSMMKQADLELEASHLNRFNSNFKYNSEVIFPKPLYPLVSKEVLVESFEPGSPIMDFIKKNDRHNPTLAKIGLSAYMQMMLVDNFVHADLHPGNVLVRTSDDDNFKSIDNNYFKKYNNDNDNDQQQQQQYNLPFKRKLYETIEKSHKKFHSMLGGIQLKSIDFKEHQKSSPKLIFLDVGLVTQLGQQDKDHFIELFTEIVNGNGKEGAELLIRYAREAKCTEEEMYQFKERMGTLFNQVQNSKLSEVHVGQFMSEILGLVREYHVKIESNFATLVMGTIVLEGLGKQLDPSLGLLKAAIPFLLKSQVFSFSNFIKDFFLKSKTSKKQLNNDKNNNEINNDNNNKKNK